MIIAQLVFVEFAWYSFVHEFILGYRKVAGQRDIKQQSSETVTNHVLIEQL